MVLVTRSVSTHFPPLSPLAEGAHFCPPATGRRGEELYRCDALAPTGDANNHPELSCRKPK